MTNYPYIICGIAIMAVVTYLTRMLPLTFFRKRVKSKFVRSFLAYVPYAVLAAMTIPEILFSTASLASAAIGLAVALILSYLDLGLLIVALSSTGAVFLTEYLMSIL